MTTTTTRRTSAALSLLIACATLQAGCATTRDGIRVPGHERVFVAVFVDESATGEVGVALAEAIQIEVYGRDPDRLAMTFDESSLALDGTVHALDEREVSGGEREIAIRATVLLVDKQGARLGEIGPVESRATYRPIAGDARATDEARRAAIARIVRTLATYVTREIDARGRAEAARAA